MQNAAYASRNGQTPWPDRILGASGILWFLTAAIGQWIFVYYVAASYIPILAKKGLPGLEETALPDGYVPGDPLGNLAIAFHVLIAIIIIGGGPLQLTPQIRNRFPKFHRMLGRTYLTTAIITSFAGLYLVWTRGVPGGLIGHLAISLDAVLIVSFAAIAVRFALRRDFDRHRRWAMRLFMVVSAVWFFRIGIMFWFLATGGIGINPETFEGPALTVMYFGQMFIPLGVLQLYFYAQDHDSAASKFTAALIVLVATGVTGAGVFAATMGMWLPRL
ncbi:DUF2306 domain-containing protein [Hyphococcus flavus]|uniref:DUF2306 domain-containing protein n=1 Tax=Hyphococcus flavus TaxID=1866326 RepID=A0AAF0CB96_9PROT|nr:DUF2306 domain-containing protein [Hyphococcus flavus]WDI30370.1 DUF2306 domain-containing protein [Hyphococcus flavus]